MENVKDKIINVPVEDIIPNRFQPRLAFDEKELTELSNSIVKYGVIQPIVLRSIGDKYEIIAGERRYKATLLAGLKTIPAIINNTDDNTSAEIALLENLQRKNLTVIEEAQSFKKLLDKNFTQEEIATKLGISQSSIANKLRLLNLPKKVQDALLHSKISERHARSLLSLNDAEQQITLLDRIINERLTVRQTEEEISRILNKTMDDNDIPDEIQKFITEKEDVIEKRPLDLEEMSPENEDISNELFKEENNDIEDPNHIENSNTERSNYFINDIPEVVDIIEDTNDNSSKGINPFQMQFEDSVRRIQDELSNRNSFFDKVNNYDDEEMLNRIRKEEEKLGEKPKIKRESLPNMISEVRNFINTMDSRNIITTSEVDLPDKYRIIIEIDKSEI